MEKERASGKVRDVNPGRAAERQRQEDERRADRENQVQQQKAVDPAEEYKRLLELKSGGRYIPPARLRALEEQMVKNSGPKDFQRLEWEKLKKKINGLINKANTNNIKSIVFDMFAANLDRGRGVFVKSLMKAQQSSLVFTSVYASLAAVINSKLPKIGELLVTRLIIQFRRAFKNNNKPICISSSIFLAHLCNQRVAHEILCLEILHLLLLKPTDDSVEIAVGFIREVGAFLQDVSSAATTGVFERFRAILHEGDLEKRTQHMIEVLFQTRKDGFLDNPPISDELDLVEEDEQTTHMIGLDDELKAQEILNVFRFDPDYEANEERYSRIKDEILGNSDDESEDSDARTDDEDENDGGAEDSEAKVESNGIDVKDMTQREMTEFKKLVYLYIKSTMSADEVVHKLMKIPNLQGHEFELVKMMVECCAEEKVYTKMFGIAGDRMCKINRQFQDLFAAAFRHYYSIIHQYDGKKILNIGTMFGYILARDGLSWDVFDCVYLDEDNSTGPSRIFVKFVFQEIKSEIGQAKMLDRINEEYIQSSLKNMFPTDRRSKCRFAINYFVAINMGFLTDTLRKKLDDIPESPPSSRSSSVSSRSSYSSRSRSRSRGRPRRRSVGSSRSYSSRSRSGSYSSRSRSYSSRSRSRSYSSRSRSFSSSRSRSVSGSRSPSPQRRGRSTSRSPPRREKSRSRSYTPPPQRPTKEEYEATMANNKRPATRSPPRREHKKRAKAADYL